MNLRFVDENGDDYPEWEETTLEALSSEGRVSLTRGLVIPKTRAVPADQGYPVYSSSALNEGLMCHIDSYDFDEELITWSIDGGGRPFYRNKHKFSVTNVSGLIKNLSPETISTRYLSVAMFYAWSKEKFDYQHKAHPSVIDKIYRILLPSLPEQEKIAGLFTVLDERVAVYSELVRLLELQKKGYLQQIFAQKLRFPDENGDDYPEWEEATLGEVFIPISVKNKDNQPLPVLSVTQERGVVRRDEQKREIKYSKDNLHTYKVVTPGDYVIGLRSFEGGIETSFLEGLVSPAYTVFRDDTGATNPDFMKQFFKTPSFITKLASSVEGIRDGRQISYPMFSKIKAILPSLPEQEKIAAFFSALDEEIVEHKKIVELAKLEKKAYLQQIFGNR